MALARIDWNAAMEVFRTLLPNFGSVDESLQLATIYFINLNSVDFYSQDKQVLFSECLGLILESSMLSPSIKYMACDTLLKIAYPSQALAAQKAFPTLVELILKESDNNIKLAILEKLSFVLSIASHSLDNQILDLWKIFSSSDIEIKRRSLSLVLEHCTDSTFNLLSDYLMHEIDSLVGKSSNSSIGLELTVLLGALSKCGLSSPAIATKISPMFAQYITDKPSNGNGYLFECTNFFK